MRPERAADAANLEKVDIRLHTIIYELTDEIKKAMTGMLDPVFKEVYKGRADVRTTFRITKVGTVAGCYVTDGVIPRDAQVRLLRDNIVVHTGRLDSLKRFKDDAGEVKSGFECGIALVGYNDLKPSDIIEAFVKEKVAPDLSAYCRQSAWLTRIVARWRSLLGQAPLGSRPERPPRRFQSGCRRNGDQICQPASSPPSPSLRRAKTRRKKPNALPLAFWAPLSGPSTGNRRLVAGNTMDELHRRVSETMRGAPSHPL